MERKKNIIFITGKNSYQVQAETERIIEAFRVRQDGNSIDRYRLEEMNDWGQLRQNIQTMGLFVEKRLFVFTGSLEKLSPKRGDTGEKKHSQESLGAEILLDICKNIDDETFLIFSGILIDPRSELSLWLNENSDIRMFNDIWLLSTWKSRFSGLDGEIIETVLKYYQKSLAHREEVPRDISFTIGQSLEQLSLLSNVRRVEKDDIEESIQGEVGEKMFTLTDTILSGNVPISLRLFRKIISSMNTHAFIPSFLGALRGSIYTLLLKSEGMSIEKISGVLPIHPFVVKKTYHCPIGYEKISRFYQEILSINTHTRSGLGMKDSELGRIFSIELAILRLKK